ncbi:unnamed protein product [Prunus armeniaca]|uniref:Uncharacterized protein n=1 Tax=Prunus armeniaca TaxID=36596 RepID=A0A6J5TKL4_PRUAR|nr:unnamed protein product [Prunus armeniaca]
MRCLHEGQPGWVQLIADARQDGRCIEDIEICKYGSRYTRGKPWGEACGRFRQRKKPQKNPPSRPGLPPPPRNPPLPHTTTPPPPPPPFPPRPAT